MSKFFKTFSFKRLGRSLSMRTSVSRDKSTRAGSVLAKPQVLETHPKYPKRAPFENGAWTIAEPTYQPVEFTHPDTIANDRDKKPGGWADPQDYDRPEFQLELQLRESFATGEAKKLQIVNGVPLNPMGRTGIVGRGLLGKFGPNFAADPLVTRFRDDGTLEMVAIERGDTKLWAIPGGMVDAGETVTITLRREFMEEASASTENSEERIDMLKRLEKLFDEGGSIVFRGYVYDMRNTDNAWMETTCSHFHIADPILAQGLPLKAGDDASAVCWLACDVNEPRFRNLYASHRSMVMSAVRRKLAQEGMSEKESKLWNAAYEKVCLPSEALM